MYADIFYDFIKLYMITPLIFFPQNHLTMTLSFKQDNSGYFFKSESRQWLPVINFVRTSMPVFVACTGSMYRNENKY